jgi:hypothetical protein
MDLLLKGADSVGCRPSVASRGTFAVPQKGTNPRLSTLTPFSSREILWAIFAEVAAGEKATCAAHILGLQRQWFVHREGGLVVAEPRTMPLR